jgi:hypothetical protein
LVHRKEHKQPAHVPPLRVHQSLHAMARRVQTSPTTAQRRTGGQGGVNRARGGMEGRQKKAWVHKRRRGAEARENAGQGLASQQ